jgi:KaiC/GvpD/RAD55 family RecA-like ATPase
VPRIPLIEELTRGSIPAGSNLLVEFDPASQWFNAAISIAAGWINTGGRAEYNVSVQPPNTIRAQLDRFGMNPGNLEREGRLVIDDFYTITLGKKSAEKLGRKTLKVSELSIEWLNYLTGPPTPDLLRIVDTVSTLSRYNEDRAWIEFCITRSLARSPIVKATWLAGITKGLHEPWVYKQLESAHDGIIDFELDTSGVEPRNMMRIRSLRNAQFDGRWHELKIEDNMRVALQT